MSTASYTNGATASIRELRTNFRAVKLKVEEFGEVVITDNGEASFVLRRLSGPSVRNKRAPLPDYYARLLEQRSEPISEAASRQLDEDNRGPR